MLFHIRKPQETGQISVVSRKETHPSHQLCPSQRALIAAWRHWGLGGHSCVRPPPQRTGGGPPPSTAGSAEWLGSAVGNFILPWNWIIFGQVRLSYTKASNGLLKPVGSSCSAPWNTDWPWAFPGQQVTFPAQQRHEDKWFICHGCRGCSR